MKISTRQHGFTLLEVMVALVIFSIGMLGLAGLQAVSLQNNQSAYNRTLATMLAYDLADRVRNNASINYASVTATNNNCTAATANCSPSQMAADDMNQWKTALSKSDLLTAAGFINADATTGGYTILIGWDQNKTGNAAPSSASNCTAFTSTTVKFECISLGVVP